jgi:hypothetical protein
MMRKILTERSTPVEASSIQRFQIRRTNRKRFAGYGVSQESRILPQA